MRAAFYTLGCKVNQYETQVLSQRFAGAGYEIVPFDDLADVFVINSCTVTAQGDKKTRQLIHRVRARCPGAVVALTGCFPQAFPTTAQEVDGADVITGSSNRAELLTAVQDYRSAGQRVVRIRPYTLDESFEPMAAVSMDGKTRAFVKIEDGCDRHCTYCIIPTARGPVRSKKLDELAGELETLATQGHREVVLTGINLSSYGKESGHNLQEAVELACAQPGLLRVRLGSLEPDLTDDRLLAALAAQPKLCPQFHLSVQSGCDATLARMGRLYTTVDYLALLTRLRGAFENPAVTTDLMVGFPGETDEEFAATLEFIEKAGFARVHVFPYSPRPGTPAAAMESQVEPSVKTARAKEAAAVAHRCRQGFLAGMVGRQEEVLFELSNHPGQQRGYTPNYTPVRVATDQTLRWQVRRVRITGVEDDGCTGQLV